MLCKRCGEICTGTSGVSIETGAAAGALAGATCSEEFASAAALLGIAFAVR
jgi:hypothetical protein